MLYQDDTVIGEFTLDGTPESEATPIEDFPGLQEGQPTPTYQETGSYHLDFENLPKYSQTGHKYTYLVLEQRAEGWYTEREYDPATRTTTIRNHIPVGEGTELYVTKRWVDGDDAAHRPDVLVRVTAKVDLPSQQTDPQTGKPVRVIKAGTVIADQIVLSESNNWFEEFGVSVGGVTYDDLIIEETGLRYPGSDVVYPVVSIDEAQEAYPGAGWINVGWTNPDNKRVATDNHVYEVAPGSVNQVKNAWEITNRRLGLVDITVDKAWNDMLDTDPEGLRPDATITLSVDRGTFSTGDNGGAYVTLPGGNTLPVLDGSGNPVAGTVSQDGSSLTVAVDTTKAASTYEFFGLPKYDGDGVVVHYSVSEQWAGDAGDYTSSMTSGEYKVGALHFHDSQEFDIINTRSATRDVVFYKEWGDQYVSQVQNQRPDITLTLYQVSAATNYQPKTVEGYVHYRWQSDDNNQLYSQSCTLTGLPKYDKLGDEIVYYATETLLANATSLGYEDATFSGERMDMEGVGTGEGQNPVAFDVSDASAPGKVESLESVSGSGIAIHEGGTFHNDIAGTVVANGVKIWTNVPGNVTNADLPGITVFIQQKLSTDESWPDLYVEKDAQGNWVPVENADGTTGAVAWTSTFDKSGYTYTYTISHTGDNSDGSAATEDTALPRYNEDGVLYEYRAREVAWGLFDTPGGITSAEAEANNFANDNVVNNVFTIRHGETGSFQLINAYEASKGNLTVGKSVEGRAQNDTFPDVTFELYRQLPSDQTGLTAVDLVATHTITSEEFAAASKDGGVTSTVSHSFTDLEIYAPDGGYWEYFVVERAVDGYTTTVALGSPTDEGAYGPGTEAQGGVSSPALMDGNASMVKADDENVDVTFRNTYKPETVPLSGSKVWDDYGNIFGKRPDILLTLTRTSASGQSETLFENESAADGNHSSNVAGKTYTFTWGETGSKAGEWTFTISDLEKWAPDGSAWRYTLSEQLAEGGSDDYRIVAGSVSGSGSAASDTVTLNPLRNASRAARAWRRSGRTTTTSTASAPTR